MLPAQPPNLPPDDVSDATLWSWVDRSAPELEAWLARHPGGRTRVDALRRAMDLWVPEDSALVPERIGGYRIGARVGSGGMGVVYRARADHPRRDVAIKVLLSGRFATSPDVQRFQREADALARLRHLGIVSVFDAGRTEEGLHYLVMEWVDGEPLDLFVERRGLELRARVRLVSEVAAAVAHAHERRVVHRDLKPSNILVDAEGHPHVLDFGLAQLEGGSRDVTMTGAVIGSLTTMSPEQATGSKVVGPTADVYALGVILYRLITGRDPYALDRTNVTASLRAIAESEPAPLRPALADVDRDLETLVHHALRKRSNERYPDAGALRDDLDRWLRNEPIGARRRGVLHRLGTTLRRRPGTVAFFVISVLVIAIITLDGATGAPGETGGRTGFDAGSAQGTQSPQAAPVRTSPEGESTPARPLLTLDAAAAVLTGVSPFDAVAWRARVPHVLVENRWGTLLDVEGIRASLLAGLAEQGAGGGLWVTRLEGELPSLLRQAGLSSIGETVSVRMRDDLTGLEMTLPVAMTRERLAGLLQRALRAFEAPLTWDGGRVWMTLDDGRYELLALDSWSMADVVTHARRVSGPSWRATFELALHDLLGELGNTPGDTLSVQLRSSSGIVERRALALTEASGLRALDIWRRDRAHTEQHGLEEDAVSLFTEVRWDGDRIDATVASTRGMVRSVDGVPWEDIVTFARTYYPKTWRMHLTEHLRQILATMGETTSDSARVRLATTRGQEEDLDTPWSGSLSRRLRRQRLSDDAR